MNVQSIKKGNEIIRRRIQKLADGTLFIKYNNEHYRVAFYESTTNDWREPKYVVVGKIEVLPKEVPPEPLVFVYTNWEGKTGIRKVVNQQFYVGCTEYHPKTQVLMKAFDLDKNAMRTFAVNDIVVILNSSKEEDNEFEAE